MRHINLEMVYSKIHMLRLVLLQPNHAITFNVPIVIIIQSQNLTCRQTDIQQKLLILNTMIRRRIYSFLVWMHTVNETFSEVMIIGLIKDTLIRFFCFWETPVLFFVFMMQVWIYDDGCTCTITEDGRLVSFHT